MPYTQKNIKNGLQTLLVGNISNSDTLLTITTGEGAMFPSNNTPLVLEQFNSSGACFKREVVNLLSKSGDILTVSRSYEECVQDDTATPKTITQNALSFNLDQGIVKISQYMTAKIFDDLENEVVQVRTDFTDADFTLLKNPTISGKSANYTLLATEKNNTIFSMNTSGGNRTFTLNPALFPTTNGCFVFTFTKSTSDANTVTINVGSGNTIDGSQTYVLTDHNESVTIVIQSSTFAKVIATNNKPVTPIVNRVKFGGNGSDGILNISSGTTTLTLSNNQLIRNYESINISGTAILDITGVTGDNGAIAYIKCRGDFTMTGGTLRMNGQGAAGGAGATPLAGGRVGSNGFNGLGITTLTNYFSQGGVASATPLVGGVATNSPGFIGFSSTILSKINKLAGGSGGAGGSSPSSNGNTNGGTGGRGGGLLILEVGGAFNFTGGTIQANGNVGGTALANQGAGGGGGGGSGGTIYVLYNTLTANTGTMQCNGGAGANGISGGSGWVYGGGGSGGSGFFASIGGNGGGSSTAGTSGASNSFGTGGAGGTSATNFGGGGGGGAAGYYLLELNTDIA